MKSSLNRIILIATSLGAFIVPFMTSSINIAMPTISNEFSLTSSMLNWILQSFTLSVAVFVLPFGRLADILGRKKILTLGMSLFVLASLLCAISINPLMLIFSRVLQGISGASIAVTVVSILSSVFPAGSRGKALGLNVAMTYSGLSMGPYLGGLLTKYFGWRSIFYFVALIGLLVVISLANLKEEWSEAKGEKMDYLGSFIFGLALLGIILGFSLINRPLGIGLALAGIALLYIFGLYEGKVKQPILDLSLLKHNRVLVFSSVAALINYSATFALSYLLSLYLQYIKGFEPSQAGLILIAQPIVMTLFSPLAGLLSDKSETQKVASIGMAITTLGLSFFIFINESTSIFYITMALIILGFGFALFSSPNTNAIMCSVEKKHYGITSAILSAARSIGQTLSMGLASMILAINIGNAQISADLPLLLLSVKATFAIMTILCFIGIFASLARGKVRN
jgi:EmrB/QacA subfamily drug resistance transporter